jgi:hypothetical protein
MSADRFKRAAKVWDSGSWNKYSYTEGDPLNFYDPSGRFLACPPGTHSSIDATNCLIDDGGDGDQNVVSRTGNGSDQQHGGAGSGNGGSTNPCPPVVDINGLPGGSSAQQIAQNIALAQQQSAQLMSLANTVAAADPSGPSASFFYLDYMAQWLYSEFHNKGPWDYKRDKSVVSQNPGNYQQVVNFGNFDFGAVLAGLGLSYYQTQNVAGAYQLYLGTANQGVLVFQWPYGDSAADATLIQQGFNYGKAVQSNCK